jgi:hypothetical protein
MTEKCDVFPATLAGESALFVTKCLNSHGCIHHPQSVLCTWYYCEEWGRERCSNGITKENTTEVNVAEWFCRFPHSPVFLTLRLKLSSHQPVPEIPTLYEIWVPSHTDNFRRQSLKISSILLLLRHSQTQLFSSTLCSRYFHIVWSWGIVRNQQSEIF